MNIINPAPSFDFDKRFWSWQEQLALFDLLDPVNGDQIRAEYLGPDSRHRSRDPIFAYAKPEFEYDRAMRQCDIFSDEVQKSDELGLLIPAYLAVIEETRNYINIFYKREKNIDMAGELTSLYGKPSQKIIAEVKRVLAIKPSTAGENKTLDAFYMASLLEQKITDLGMDWKIEVSPALSARISVSSLHKRIRVKRGEMFAIQEAHRLLAHEIEVHVFRRENGFRQQYAIFQHGFPGYIETEEGLAAYSEHRMGLLSHDQLRVYAARALAADIAADGSFTDVFTALMAYLSSEQAYAITQRVKRGLVDTSQPGGFTKDQCYLSGYIRVRQAATPALLKLLYSGKVGLDDTDLVNQLAQSGNLASPKYLPQWFTE